MPDQKSVGQAYHKKFNKKPTLTQRIESLEKWAEGIEGEWSDSIEKVKDLENRFSHSKQEREKTESKMVNMENKMSDSDIYSDSFLRRAFAIFGHNLVAYLIIWLAIMIVMAIVGVIF